MFSNRINLEVFAVFKFYHLLLDPTRRRIIRGVDMLSYDELRRENDYLRGCLGLEGYVYGACILVVGGEVKLLGVVKFLNGVDHWRSREKMFVNVEGEKYWALVEKSVYEGYRGGRDSFVVRGI
tara:strand:- start:11154 stop:11525 length:372 start_codon:yes stop_codon:yes gene_type:complete